MFDDIQSSIPTHTILNTPSIRLDLKRLDLVHSQISGNKFFKLKYNFLEAKQQACHTVLTFGGAYSNHIAATAYAAHLYGFKSIGIIRGEELQYKALNNTLQQAQNLGMQLIFVSREEYKQRYCPQYLNILKQEYSKTYIIPEGGTNSLAIQGCKEILTSKDQAFYDVICCAVGTGGTISGLIEATQPNQTVLGFSALKGDFLITDVSKLTHKKNWQIHDTYSFGGYAKTTPELIQFIQDFENQYGIPLEPIYTGKLMYGLFDLIQQNYFKTPIRILAIHTGGLQGRSSLMPSSL